MKKLFLSLLGILTAFPVFADMPDQFPHAWQQSTLEHKVESSNHQVGGHKLKLGFGGTSTINPNIPAMNSPLTSAPIRNNFQAAYNDVNSLYEAIAAAIANPPGGTNGQLQYNAGMGGFGGYTMGGDCTLLPTTGIITCTKTNGTSLGTMAVQNASGVAITGGSIAGITSYNQTQGNFNFLNSGANFNVEQTLGNVNLMPGTGGINLEPGNGNVLIGATGTGNVYVEPSGAGFIEPTASLIIEPGSIGFLDRMEIGLSVPEPGFFTTLSATGNSTFANGVLIEPGVAGAGTWINMPTSGPSGIGDSGVGINSWIAYTAGAGQWFSDTVVGDIAYRVQPSNCQRFGNASATTSLFDICATSIAANIPIAPSSAASSGNCSTSGTYSFSEPFTGSAYKRVTIYLNACIGTASYTFGTAFAHTPQILTTNGPAAAIVTSLSNTAATVTGATTTGYIFLEGN